MLMREAGISQDALEEALATLGFSGRDCELVFSRPGVPPGHARFINAAAKVCAEVFDRRAATYDDNSKIILKAMISRGENDGDPKSLLEAAQALHVEWQQTARAFGAVEATDAPDAALWAEFVQHTETLAAHHGARAAALESGAPEKLATAFRPTPVLPITPNALGLGQTDCRTLTF